MRGQPLVSCLILAISLGMGACSDDGVRPRRHAQGGSELEVTRVPLGLGSRWTYHHGFTGVMIDAYDNVTVLVQNEGVGVRALTQLETIDGREYVVEHQSLQISGRADPVESWCRYRQTADTLYRADVPTTVPPGGVGPGEVVDRTRLVYPLAVGDSWTVWPHDVSAVVTVEALDTLSLVLGEVHAFRLRVDVDTDGENDRRRLWFGAAGLLRRTDHIEVVAFDPGSGETVRLVTDEVEELTAVELVEPASNPTRWYTRR